MLKSVVDKIMKAQPLRLNGKIKILLEIFQTEGIGNKTRNNQGQQGSFLTGYQAVIDLFSSLMPRVHGIMIEYYSDYPFNGNTNSIFWVLVEFLKTCICVDTEAHSCASMHLHKKSNLT